MRRTYDNPSRTESLTAAGILEVLSAGATALLNAEDLSDVMPDLLRRLGNAVGVSRAYLFDVEDDPERGLCIWQRFEWCAEGVEPQIDNPSLQGPSFADLGFERWRHLMVAGQAVHGAVTDFPQAERNLLEAQGIQSLVCLPVHGEAMLAGFIGFDDCERERQWTQPELDALHTAAELIGAVKQRFSSQKLTHERDRLFRILAEQTSDIVSMGDAHGVLSYVSPSVERSLGYAPAQVIGRTFYDLQHPEDTERFKHELRDNTLGDLSKRALSYRMRHRDGHWVWLETRLNAQFDEAGEILHSVVDKRRDTLGVADDKTIASIHALGIVRFEQGRHAEAADLFREEIAGLNESSPGGHWHIADARSRLGACFTSMGKFDEAESMLLDSYAELKDTFGDRDDMTLQAKSRIVALYKAWGREDAARPYMAN